MKKILYILSAFVCLSLSMTSCDALFDSLEGDLTKMTGEDMASSEAGIQMLLAQVYSYIPMNACGYEDQYTPTATAVTTASTPTLIMACTVSRPSGTGEPSVP